MGSECLGFGSPSVILGRMQGKGRTWQPGKRRRLFEMCGGRGEYYNTRSCRELLSEICIITNYPLSSNSSSSSSIITS